jgi:hypothetical protein
MKNIFELDTIVGGEACEQVESEVAALALHLIKPLISAEEEVAEEVLPTVEV